MHAGTQRTVGPLGGESPRISRHSFLRRLTASCSLLASALLGLVLLGIACGCRTMERTMVGVSRVKLPITIDIPAVNRALSTGEMAALRIDPVTLKPEGPAAPAVQVASGARVDDLADLTGGDTKIFVCLSGGGSRAARMAAHSLAALEQEYNARLGAEASRRPLVSQIDAWSSVSGGSVFASYVAVSFLKDNCNEETFQRLLNSPRTRWATQRLGGAATIFYFWPLNLGYAPLMQLLTEWDTLNLFARTHAMFQEGRLPILPASRLCKLGDLRPRPRFYFNATCTESGRSIVFTQSVLHRDLSGDPVARLPSDPLLDWAEGRDVEEQSRSEPLSSATTLEDLGSSTAAFPLAYAVFASAAFPGVFQPLQLQKFVGAGSALAPAGSKPPPVWRREGLLTIVDGAMYDNTGRTTALEVFAYLRKRAASDTGAGRLVLLVIDADNDPDSYKGPDTSPRLPWHVDLPVRGLLPAVSTVARLYNKQQSLVRAALARRIQAWVKEGVLDYFEIRLMDVTHQAEQIRAIPTDFVITDFEDARLKEAVRELLNRPRSGNTGPTVASAFVDAVRAARARSQ